MERGIRCGFIRRSMSSIRWSIGSQIFSWGLEVETCQFSYDYGNGHRLELKSSLTHRPMYLMPYTEVSFGTTVERAHK